MAELTVPPPLPVPLLEPEETWGGILKRTRDAHTGVTSSGGDPEEFVDTVQFRFQQFHDQLVTYACLVATTSATTTSSISAPSDPNSDSRPGSHDNNSPSSSASGISKDMIIETRAALRFGMCCCSLATSSVSAQIAIQRHAVIISKWHEPLAVIVAAKNGDSKCRLFAARLFSNLVTNNYETANIISNWLQLTPGDDVIKSTMLENLTDDTVDADADAADDDDKNEMTFLGEPNWVDMIVSCSKSGNRDALAAVAASLHNCIISLNKTTATCITSKSNAADDENGGNGDDDDDDQFDDRNDHGNHGNVNDDDYDTSAGQFARIVASNTMIINALLRYFVTTESIKASISTSTSTSSSIDNQQSTNGDGTNDKNDKDNNNNHHDPWDGATEWIYLVLTSLTRFGFLPDMYNAISSSSSTNETGEGTLIIVPEQNVLLNCIVHEAESYAADCIKSNTPIHQNDDDDDDNDDDERSCPFGKKSHIGQVWITFDFLSNQLIQLYETILSSSIDSKNTSTITSTTSTTTTTTESQLIISACISILEILGIILGTDSDVTTIIREYYGTKTCIIQESSKYLNILLEELSRKNDGKKAREQKMSLTEQKLITSLVRLIGNLCYKCTINQDLMRTTLIPSSSSSSQQQTQHVHVHEHGQEQQQPMPVNGQHDDERRNALHVLLSCTSLITSCLTLREWSIVAIRNILENNINNQNIVTRLNAQSPIQSSVLNNAGIKVSLDNNGKVSLSTVKEEVEEK